MDVISSLNEFRRMRRYPYAKRRAQTGGNQGKGRLPQDIGDFQRSFTLSCPIDANKTEAHIKNGVLRLILPQAEEAKPRKITVKIG